jgi:transcriptional regulator with XRE-family HTH domain
MADSGRTPKDIARRLVALREALGYSQSGWARFLGILPSQQNNYEQGIRRVSLSVAQDIALKTDVTLDWIYFGSRSGLPLNLLPLLTDLSAEQPRQRA